MFDADHVVLVDSESKPYRVAWVVKPFASINVSKSGMIWGYSNDEFWHLTSQVLAEKAAGRFVGLLEINRKTPVKLVVAVPKSTDLETIRFSIDEEAPIALKLEE